MPGTLFLIPTNLSEPFAPGEILPKHVIETAKRLDHYIAENAKTARAFLKALELSRPIQGISINELNGRQSGDALRKMVQPLLDGHDVGLVSEAGAPGVAD